MMTAEEKLMYQVMKAIYDSGIPIDFKGSIVLKACLLEAGYTEEIRHGFHRLVRKKGDKYNSTSLDEPDSYGNCR